LNKEIVDFGDDKKNPDPAILCRFNFDKLERWSSYSGADNASDVLFECDSSLPVDVVFFGSPRFRHIELTVKYGNLSDIADADEADSIANESISTSDQ